MALRIEDYALIGDTRRRRWSAGTARSTGCACRGSTPARASPPCSARPRTGGGCSPRPARSARQRAATATTRWCWRPSSPPTTARSGSSTACRCGTTAARTWCASSRGCAARVPMRMELVIRFDYGPVVPWVRAVGTALAAIAGPDALSLRRRRPARAARTAAPSPTSRRRRARGSPFVLTWSPVAPSPPPPLDAGKALADDRALVAGLGGPLPLRREVARRGGPLADDPEGADLRADRRDRRRADHLPARAARRRAQLGLPVLLAPRRDLHPARADHAGYDDGGGGVAGVAAAGRGGRPGADCRSCTAWPASGG